MSWYILKFKSILIVLLIILYTFESKLNIL